MRFRKYLKQIFLQLKGAGYVRKHKGAKGGYELAKPPEKITLAEVIRLIDGPCICGFSQPVLFEHTPSSKMKTAAGV